jgi:hypothetical protein
VGLVLILGTLLKTCEFFLIQSFTSINVWTRPKLGCFEAQGQIEGQGTLHTTSMCEFGVSTIR